MKTTTPRLLLALCAAAAAWAAGCKAPPKPMKFNKLLVESNNKLAEAGKAFRKTVEPLGEGKPVKPGEVESSFRNMQSTVASVKSMWEDMQAPMKSSAGPTVLEKYQAFLDAEESKVLPRFQSIVTIVKDGQLGPAAKWGKIQGVFQAIADEENKALRPVREAQTAYAKEHNLQLDQVFFGGGGGGGPSMSGSGGGPPGRGSGGGGPPPGRGSGSGRGGPPGG